MKRNRSKKKTKDEVIYTKTKFILWLLLCRHFVLYLLKEYLFYIAESSQWLNELLSVDYKFLRYREIVRIGNGLCRKKLSQQAKERALHESFDWSVIEFEEKSTETYDIKSGEIKKFHAWSLTVARKVQKDDFMKILAKKMTNTEESITLTSPYVPFYYIAEQGEVASEGRTVSLEELHFICWCMAKNKKRIMETRWFQVIGMSRQGLETLRTWLFFYNTYDIPDNSFKKLIKEFHANSAKDYMMLKTVFKLIEYYRQDQIFHLPLCYAKKQIFALRRLLGIEDWEATPRLLGYAYQCSGCHRFANTIIEPIDHSHKQRLAIAAPQTQLPSLETQDKQKKGVGWARTTEPKKKKGRKRKSIATTLGMGDERTKTKLNEANNTTNNLTSCFLNMTLYNMDDGKLYCPRYNNQYKDCLMSQDLANGRIIMRRKDNSIVIRSNKKMIHQIEPKTSSNKKKQKYERQSISQANKEREAKKFQWLLERRVFDLNDANNGDENEPLDNITCGLFAPTEQAQEDTDSEAPLKTSHTTVTKKNNKKVILTHVNRAITDMGFTCNRELSCIDMIGIIKNGKVLCVECGSMTEFCNYNITNHGITCGRHKSVYDSDYDREPCIANPDKRSLNSLTAASLEIEYQQHHLYQPMTNHKLKRSLHAFDIIQKGDDFLSQLAYIEGEYCAYCSCECAKYRITAVGNYKRIMKIGLCKSCYILCSNIVSRHNFVSLSDIYLHLKNRKPL